jgi:large subunit ribosomal protein L25
MKSLAINGSLRETNGKKEAKALRDQGNVLCVLYGGKEPVHFAAPVSTFKKLVYNHEVHTVDLTIDGKSYSAIMKDIQFHPITDEILHIDFLELVSDKPVEMEIPVRVVGNSVGVKAGGKLVKKVRKLKVKASPADLPDFIEVNVDNLDIGKAIKVADIQLKGVQLLDAPNNVITTVKTTRQVAAEGAAPAAK